MVDYSKHHEFKSYLTNLNIEEPIKYFEIVLNHPEMRFMTHYCYYLELDESFVEKLNYYELSTSKVIIPIDDNFIQMITFTLTQFHGGETSGGEVMRANQSFIINHLKEKNLVTSITPNCKQGSNSYDLTSEIARNQDYYSNQMKKKSILIELNDTIDKLKDENNKLKVKLNKKDILNKRMINILMCYKSNEFNIVEKYDYNAIKQKNKALNTEFKRVAKLMKLH